MGGRVVEHQLGWRAEYAYPRRIIVPRTFRGYLHADDGRTIRRVFAAEAAEFLRSVYGVSANVG